ncbi:hypothetical protein HUJ05_012290 [Dendroctonus ponderosae]|nr:hypothetical protein HUJ05_012290 [Dendroctonus ponderosae]
MVDQWFAYTTSVLNGAAPSLEYLEKLERKELMKKKDHTDQHTYPLKSPVVVSEELLDKPDNLIRTPKRPLSILLKTLRFCLCGVDKDFHGFYRDFREISYRRFSNLLLSLSGQGNHGGPKRIQTPAAHGRKLLDENMDISITSSPRPDPDLLEL